MKQVYRISPWLVIEVHRNGDQTAKAPLSAHAEAKPLEQTLRAALDAAKK
ncbi:hypothetical protein ACSSV1_000196 [Labrenzia sp. MBR-25]